MNRFYFLLIALFALSCTDSNDNTLFSKLNSFKTGIDFENTLEETMDLNILTYDYTYNGGGVAVGDVNNDGLSDVYFSGNMVTNKLYLNKGELDFKDITSTALVEGKQGWK